MKTYSKIPEESDGFVPTLNRMGFMATTPSPNCKKFIDFAKPLKLPVADLGVAYGVTTRLALNAGLTVYANDLSQKHLSILYDSMNSEQKSRLSLYPGRIPNEVDFLPSTFSAILAERWLHFLTGDEIEETVGAFYRWLSKGGKAFVVAETPYISALEKFIPIYEERKKNGVLWPGIVEDWSLYSNKSELPVWTNMLDLHVLKRTFEKIGFFVEELRYISRPYFPKDVRYDNRESVGIIGYKV